MIEEVLKSIGHVAIFPLLALFLFIAGFSMVLVNVWRMKPSEVEYASRLPLEDGSAPDSTSGHEDTVSRSERAER